MLEQISTLNANQYQIEQELLLRFREMLICGKELRCLFEHSEEDSEILGCMGDQPIRNLLFLSETKFED